MGLERGRWDGCKNNKSTNYKKQADKEAKIVMRVSQRCTHIYTHTYFLCMCAFNLTSFMFLFVPGRQKHPWSVFIPNTQYQARTGETQTWPGMAGLLGDHLILTLMSWTQMQTHCFFTVFLISNLIIYFLLTKYCRGQISVLWEPPFWLASPPSGAIFEQTLWKCLLGCPYSR